MGTVPIWLLALALGGCASLSPGDFAFGVLGDTPYSTSEVAKLDAMIPRINAQPLAFVVHVGDLGSSATTQGCSNAWLDARARQFAAIRAPFIIVPGDNEWTDCAHHGMDPAARLDAWRQRFCRDAPGLALERQRGHCENARWRMQGFDFVALGVPGGSQGPGVTLDAADAWLDDSLARAARDGAKGAVVFLHADLRFEREGHDDGYARLRDMLAMHAAKLDGRLTLVHGDTHWYRVDTPRPGLRRIEPWGSPFVSWLRIDAGRGGLRVSADP
ncbi:MAG: metallophosphoesterase family protein [Burkholderiales bacterium]